MNGISMIPFALLSGFVNGKEIRITELAKEGFRFRMVHKIPEPYNLTICFYDLSNSQYNEIPVTQYVCAKRKEEEFYYEYTILTSQEDFICEVQRLERQYSQYIHWKLEETDSALACAMTGYPSDLDEIYADSLDDQKKNWFPADWNLSSMFSFAQGMEAALSLDTPRLYKEYLQKGIRENFIPNRLYIGNQFCPFLFPEETILFAILEKAKSQSLAITLAFSYIREFLLDATGNLLDKLEQWCQTHQIQIEILVNDWAMAELIRQKKTEHLIPCLGILLNKRKKDPRFSYKKGDTSFYEQNSLNAEFYRNYLQTTFAIERYEWEACEQIQQFPPGKNSLHLPLYQTNTSSYCPLYAICTTGKRGQQTLITSCPSYCSKYAFLYPEHLHMVGRYNSLFALDLELIRHPEKLQNYNQAGIDRIIWNLL